MNKPLQMIGNITIKIIFIISIRYFVSQESGEQNQLLLSSLFH